MFLACFDVETFLIEKGRMVPPFVVLGWTTYDTITKETKQGGITHRNEVWGDDVGFIDGCAPTVESTMRRLIHDVERRHAAGTASGETAFIINQNISFDWAVLAEFFREKNIYPEFLDDVFRLYDKKLVRDTMLNEQLEDVAEGCLGFDFTSRTAQGNPKKKYYSLSALAKSYLKFDMDKTTWRTGYDKLYDVPLSQWEEGAKDYVILDTQVTIDVFQQQLVRAGVDHIPDSENQPRFAWALHLMSAWGVRTDGAAAAVFKGELEARLKVLEVDLVQHGLMRTVGERSSKHMVEVKSAIEQAYKDVGVEVPKTEKGSTSTDAETIRDVVALLPDTSEYKILRKLSDHQSTQKLLNTYVPVLEEGARVPINARYTCILETGRTSCSGPNLQNLPRGDDKSEIGKLSKRVRECFIPRDGYVFCSCDYDSLELRTFSQVALWMVGHSDMGEAINEGLDPHLKFANDAFLHLPYEEALARHKAKDKEVGDRRQVAKIGNFGLLGGMSAGSFVDYCKGYGVSLSLTESEQVKRAFLKQWSEVPKYFNLVKGMTGGFDSDGGEIEQFISKRIRGRTGYTVGCNTFFQGLAADLAKHACYLVQKACYTPGSPLYGSRLAVFVHDELIMEHPIDTAHERAYEQARLMGDALQMYCPDIKRKDPDPALMTRWIKGADKKFDENGRLIPWA